MLENELMDQKELLARHDEQSRSVEFAVFDEEEPSEQDSLLPSEAFVTTSDWTTETIVSQLAKGSIDVNPGFQRRDAWDVKRKRLFIESIFLGIPIPQLVLAEKDRGQYIVLDGKQRLLTLLSFSESYAMHYDHPLKLQKLPYLRNLDDKTWKEIQADPENRTLVRAFENASIRTVLIRNWKTEDFLHLIFNRLNTGSLPLSSQELRAALHPGEFTRYIEESSAKNAPLQRLLRISKPDFRMRDAELQLRSTAFDLLLSDYSGSLRDFLNRAQKTFNARWQSHRYLIERSTAEFVTVLEALNKVFAHDAGRRYTTDGYERTMNRAVLDALVFCFRSPELRQAALSHPADARKVYQQICLDPIFAMSVQFTTKTPSAIRDRLDIMSDMYSKAFGIRLPRVLLNENRLLRT